MSKIKKSRRIELEKVERRKKIFEQRRNKTKKIIAISTVFIIVIGLGIFFMISSEENIDVEDALSDPQSIIQTSTQIKIPTSDISEDANFYSYESDGVNIKYFTVRGSDGEIRVAMNACDVCYHAKKGYVQDDNEMRCINCGLKYSISGLGTTNLEGGCWPSYLPKKIENDFVVININDLEEKRYMFA
jgi:uncharacterized membrane protein